MYKSFIALEVRILLQTGVKVFCPCAYAEAGTVESCPVCRRETGAAPVLNPEAAAKAYDIARALGCALVETPVYERNETTPDVPDQVALSGLSLKIAAAGALDITFHRRTRRIRIAEIRIEEDAGRLTHSASKTRMDYARAGMPSLRIRTEGDIEMGEEAEVFLSELRRLIQYLEIMPGVPVESVIRCNAHVALAQYPANPENFVKLRNLNSFNFVRKAINADLGRQEDILTSGGHVVTESRIWNETKNQTESFQKRPNDMGSRFIPVPGLQPFVPKTAFLWSPETEPVELPQRRRDRLVREYGLMIEQADFICDERSRADFFEQTVAIGAHPLDVMQWLATFVEKERRRLNVSLPESALTSAAFAELLKMLSERRIHGGIAKQAISAALAEGVDPVQLIRERGWEQLTERSTIEKIVERILEENPKEVARVRDGDSRPLRFLTGLIMRETKGLAEPVLVKEILRDQLSISLVYVLSMGGLISARRAEDGTVEPGDERVLRELLSQGSLGPDASSPVRFEPIQVGRIFSEDIMPSDWAALITAITEKLNSGTANGIVVAHGTDTLAYTASLIYWLFADANAPIVFVASSIPPGPDGAAAKAMEQAVRLAVEKKSGVYVVYGGKVLSPLNLKFERPGENGCRNWNMAKSVHQGTGLLTGPLEADTYVLSQLLAEALDSLCVVRLYPGLKSEYLISLMDQGVTTFFLELYDTGLASFREGPYSLRKAFAVGRKRGVKFFCTSQQEAVVDFSGYANAQALWREGAVPLGELSTESAVARFLASSLIADSEEERLSLMEGARV